MENIITPKWGSIDSDRSHESVEFAVESPTVVPPVLVGEESALGFFSLNLFPDFPLLEHELVLEGVLLLHVVTFLLKVSAPDNLPDVLATLDVTVVHLLLFWKHTWVFLMGRVRILMDQRCFDLVSALALHERLEDREGVERLRMRNV